MPTLRFSGLSVSMLRGVAQEVTPTLAQVCEVMIGGFGSGRGPADLIVDVCMSATC